jgi:hypothetical protein
MALKELQIYGLWAGKQTAKGTGLAAPAHRFKVPGGGWFNAPREDGSENYSDATQFPDTQDWVNTLVGNGAPPTLATPDELAFDSWAFHGGETTSAVVGPPAKTKHTTTQLPGLGHWLTFVTREGSSVIDRLQWNDCQIGQLEIGGSTGSKAVRVTPTVICLDPAEQRAADPVAVMPVKASLLYTDGTGRFEVDGTVFRGHTEFTLTINKDLQPVYSDDVTVYDLALGNVVVTIGVSLVFDVDGHAQWNKLLYGTVAPAAGAKPAKFLTGLGSYGFDLRARDNVGVANGDKFVLDVASVKWALPDAPDPNPDGGPSTITLSGAMRKPAAGNPYTIDVDTDAAAFTA